MVTQKFLANISLSQSYISWLCYFHGYVTFLQYMLCDIFSRCSSQVLLYSAVLLSNAYLLIVLQTVYSDNVQLSSHSMGGKSSHVTQLHVWKNNK